MSVLLRGGPLPSHRLHAPPGLSLADAGHAAWRAEALATDGTGLHYTNTNPNANANPNPNPDPNPRALTPDPNP